MLRGQRANSPIRQITAKVRAGASRFRPLSERRKTGRLKGESLHCSRGKVMDLSAGGMRLRSSRRYSSKLTIDLASHSRQISVPAEVRWTKGHAS